jgi:hypothetical protein
MQLMLSNKAQKSKILLSNLQHSLHRLVDGQTRGV